MSQAIKQEKNRSTILRLFSRLKDQRVRLIVVAVSIVIYIGLSIWTPMYSAQVVDHLWQSIQAAWRGGIPFSVTWTHMGRELTQLSIQYFFTWIFYYLQSYLMASVAESLNLKLRSQIARKLNRLPLRFFDENKAGEILSRVTSDLDKIAEVLQTGLLKLLVAIGTVVIAIIAGRAMLQGSMTVGVVQAFFQYVNQTAEPLTEASFMINSLQSALASAKRTFELLDEEEERLDPQRPAEEFRYGIAGYLALRRHGGGEYRLRPAGGYQGGNCGGGKGRQGGLFYPHHAPGVRHPPWTMRRPTCRPASGSC